MDNEIITQFQTLLMKSEERIDKTNAMIHELATATERTSKMMQSLCGKYMHHVDALASCRDKLVEQNGKLIELLANARRDVEGERDRYDAVMSALLARKDVEVNCK